MHTRNCKCNYSWYSTFSMLRLCNCLLSFLSFFLIKRSSVTLWDLNQGSIAWESRALTTQNLDMLQKWPQNSYLKSTLKNLKSEKYSMNDVKTLGTKNIFFALWYLSLDSKSIFYFSHKECIFDFTFFSPNFTFFRPQEMVFLSFYFF